MISQAPNRENNNVKKKIARIKRKIERTVKFRRYTFALASQEVTARGFCIHSEAKRHWDEQTCRASWRKLLMSNGHEHKFSDIMSGNKAAKKMSTKARSEMLLRTIATRKARENDIQLNYLEPAGFLGVIELLNINNTYEWSTIPDGLGADFAIRIKNATFWAAIQVKTATVNSDHHRQYRIRRCDGETGGKYENMIIIAAGVKPIRPISCTYFDELHMAQVQELLVFKSAKNLPHQNLLTTPRKAKNDKYGDNRYEVGFDTDQRLSNLRDNFKQMIMEQAKFPLEDIWFDDDMNTNVAATQATEVRNLKCLANILMFENLRAPIRQNECTDIVVKNDGTEIRISLKTASTNGTNGYRLGLKKAPNVHFCDYMMIFYQTDTTVTHISVVPAKRAYKKLLTSADDGDRHKQHFFFWSPVHKTNKDVWHDRLNVRDPKIRNQLLSKIT